MGKVFAGLIILSHQWLVQIILVHGHCLFLLCRIHIPRPSLPLLKYEEMYHGDESKPQEIEDEVNEALNASVAPI